MSDDPALAAAARLVGVMLGARPPGCQTCGSPDALRLKHPLPGEWCADHWPHRLVDPSEPWARYRCRTCGEQPAAYFLQPDGSRTGAYCPAHAPDPTPFPRRTAAP